MKLASRIECAITVEAKLCVLVAILSIGAFPASSASVWGKPSPQKWGPIEVNLVDEAQGGCWTNLRESKAYAEDKLSVMGFDVVEDSGFGGYALSINVNAFRLSDGLCVGSVDLQIYKAMTDSQGQFGFFEVAIGGGIFTRNQNGNDYIIENISLLMDELRADLI